LLLLKLKIASKKTVQNLPWAAHTSSQ
jgi:hypothetical protein